MENIFQCCNVENLKKCNLSNFPFIQSSNKIQTIDEKAEVYISNDNYNHMKNMNLNRSDIMNLGDYSKSFSEHPKNLELIVENSVSIQKGEIIIITPNGLLDSRNKRKRLNNEVLFKTHIKDEARNKIIQANFKIETQSKITRLIPIFLDEETKTKYQIVILCGEFVSV